ncbi:MAG: hypothetical protein J6W10_05005 [Kiritimatiellae bacterium]|nr:hypothetical protein [Kiritimatiellia bacterium]
MLKPFFIKKKNIDDRLLPSATVADVGKIVAVTEDGGFDLVEAGGGGGGSDPDFDIFFSYYNDGYSTTISNYTVNKSMTMADLTALLLSKKTPKAVLTRRYIDETDPDATTYKYYPAVFTWVEYLEGGTSYKLHFNEFKTTSATQVTLTFNASGTLTAVSTS